MNDFGFVCVRAACSLLDVLIPVWEGLVVDIQMKMAVCSFIAMAGTAAWVIVTQSNELGRLKGTPLALLDDDERKAEEPATKPVSKRQTKNLSV